MTKDVTRKDGISVAGLVRKAQEAQCEVNSQTHRTHTQEHKHKNTNTKITQEHSEYEHRPRQNQGTIRRFPWV